MRPNAATAVSAQSGVRWTRNCCSSTVVLCLAGLYVARPAYGVPDQFDEYGPFQMSSVGSGQLSTGVFQTPIRTAGLLQVAYVAPESHCSDVRMHFLLDGREHGQSQAVAPGHSSGFFDFGAVVPGEHTLGLQAEGIEGGCNHGGLKSWSGRTIVRTSLDEHAVALGGNSTLGPVVFYVSDVNLAWGYRRQGLIVTSSGAVFTYRYDTNEHPLNHDATADPGPTEADLRERFRHHQTFVARIEPDVMQARVAQLGLLSREASINHPCAQPAIEFSYMLYGVYRIDSSANRYSNLEIGRSCLPATAYSAAAVPLLQWLRELVRTVGGAAESSANRENRK